MTGGAGYIGSHVVRAFSHVGLGVVVLDDLSGGHRVRSHGCAVSRGQCGGHQIGGRTLSEHQITGVVHLAGFKYAGVSVTRPVHTHEQNVTGTVHLLAAMAAKG